MTTHRGLASALLLALAAASTGCEPGMFGGAARADTAASIDAGAQADGLRLAGSDGGGDDTLGADSAVRPREMGVDGGDANARSGADASTSTACAPIAGASYAALSTSIKTDRPAAVHGDINVLLRKQRVVAETRALINVNGPVDPALPPQLYALFADERVPTFSAVYQVEHWDWGCNCAKGWLTQPAVTLAGMATSAGEVILAPKSGYDIGSGFSALVLYATEHTITLKYTREDNVVNGYTVHIDGVCVEPRLLALYRALDSAGRASLPALAPRQALGRARASEIRVAIRDTGSWMDPRVRKDWWQGK